MLNMRLVQPDLLIDITGVEELRQVKEEADGLVIGACVTHSDIEDGRAPDVTGGALPSVARGIAYRAVRNRGTIGGSLTHADPSADWISFLAALGALVTLRGPRGARTIPVEDYMLGALEADSAPANCSFPSRRRGSAGRPSGVITSSVARRANLRMRSAPSLLTRIGAFAGRLSGRRNRARSSSPTPAPSLPMALQSALTAAPRTTRRVRPACTMPSNAGRTSWPCGVPWSGRHADEQGQPDGQR